MKQQSVSRPWRLAPSFAAIAAALASGGLLTVVDQAVVSLTNLIWIRQIGRTLPLESLGDYYCLMAFVLLALNVEAQLLTAPYAVRSHQKKAGTELDGYTGAVFFHEFVVLSITCALFFGGAIVAALNGWSSLPALAALCIAAPCYLMRMFVRFVCFSREQHLSAVALDVAVAVVQLGGLYVLCSTAQLELYQTFAVLGLSSGVMTLVWLRWTPVRWTFRRETWQAWKENWSFGRWALLSFAVVGVLSHVFPWLVALMADRSQAGFLGACTTISGVATMFVIGLANGLTPAAARTYAENGKRALLGVLGRNAAAMGVAVVGFLIVAVVAGDWILARLVYDGRFTGQGTTLAWLAAAVLATAASVIFGNGLWAIERPKLNLSADIVALVATVSLALWWIPSGGAVGAASAICIGNSAGALVRGLVFLAAIRAIVDDGQIDASGPPESSAC